MVKISATLSSDLVRALVKPLPGDPGPTQDSCEYSEGMRGEMAWSGTQIPGTAKVTSLSRVPQNGHFGPFWAILSP